jgi:hypothetical protein
MRLAGAFAALAAPLEIARFAYYGSITPNTYQAKTGGGAGRILFGLAYAKLFVLTHLPLVGACAAAAARLRARDARDRRAIDLAVVGIGWSAYVIWIGGDGFPGFRFWLPILPCAGALAARALTHGEKNSAWNESVAILRRGPVVGAMGVLVVAFSAFAALPDARLEHDTGREFTARMIAVGQWLRGHAPPGAVIAVNYVGALPYHSGLRTIDMLGLTDPVIARTPIHGRFRFTGHARGNGSSVLDRRPELILMNGVYLEREPMRELAPQLDSEEQIAADPRFRAEYRRVDARIQGPQGLSWFSFYRREDVLIDVGSRDHGGQLERSIVIERQGEPRGPDPHQDGARRYGRREDRPDQILGRLRPSLREIAQRLVPGIETTDEEVGREKGPEEPPRIAGLPGVPQRQPEWQRQPQEMMLKGHAR